jgi:hypothetical protein
VAAPAATVQETRNETESRDFLRLPLYETAAPAEAVNGSPVKEIRQFFFTLLLEWLLVFIRQDVFHSSSHFFFIAHTLLDIFHSR